MKNEELALRILHAIFPDGQIANDEVVTVAAIITEALTTNPRKPRQPRPVDPNTFERDVQKIVRLSVTGKPCNLKEITRLRAYDSERFDRIADSVREEERKRVNPFNAM